MIRKIIITIIALSTPAHTVVAEVVRPSQVSRGGSSFQDNHLNFKLESLGFKCESASSGRLMCRGKVEAYPEPIRIYIPKDKRPGSKLALHFHGNNIGPGGPRDSSFHFKNGAGDFGQWLDNAGLNDVLVVPESIGETRTYDSLFNRNSLKDTAKNFSRFLGELESLMGQTFSEIAISGHSAGYRAIGALGLARAVDPNSDLNRVSAIGLFDSVYGRTDELVSWLPHLKNRTGVFYCVYTKGGGTVSQGPGDQRHLNAWLKKNEGLIPIPHGIGGPIANFSIMTTTASHMAVLQDNRYTDFLRLLQYDKRREK